MIGDRSTGGAERLRTGRLRTGVALVAVAAVLLTACSTKGDKKSSSSGSAAASGGGGGSTSLKTDVGVSSSTITLGVLTDLSGVFAVLGKSVTQGAQLYFDQLNKGAKICGRTVKLLVKDHGYDVQRAVSLYTDMAPQVLGFEQLLGSPVNAALKSNIESDKVLTVPASWASTILDNKNNMIVGATYDVEMINGVQFLVDQGKIKKGDKIGHIYLEGEYGENGYRGSKYAASKLGLTVVGQKVQATTTDLSSQVASLKNSGVKAIMLTTTPAQTASAAGVDAAIGLNVPLLGNNPVYAPQLLATAAGPALKKLLYVAASWQPYSGDAPGTTKVRSLYSAAHPKDIPNGGVDWGYGAAAAYATVLQKACSNGDMTRDGVQKAFRQTTSINTDGILPTLDYSKPGDPATREVDISQPSDDPGGLKIVQPLKASALATSYVAPEHGKGS